MIHTRGLGQRMIITNNNGALVDVVTGDPGSAPGLMRNARTYAEQAQEGLTHTPTAWPMWARAGAGFIKTGGVVLLVYGAVKTGERIAETSTEELPIVIAEEAGAWGGGFIGNVLGSALGGAFICSETGPGAFFCAVGFGLAGGITGGVIGKEAMHDLAKMADDLKKMTPAQMIETTTLMFGTPDQKRSFYELQDILDDIY